MENQTLTRKQFDILLSIVSSGNCAGVTCGGTIDTPPCPLWTGYCVIAIGDHTSWALENIKNRIVNDSITSVV